MIMMCVIICTRWLHNSSQRGWEGFEDIIVMYRTVFGSKVMIRGCTHDIINLVAYWMFIAELKFFWHKSNNMYKDFIYLLH